MAHCWHGIYNLLCLYKNNIRFIKKGFTKSLTSVNYFSPWPRGQKAEGEGAYPHTESFFFPSKPPSLSLYRQTSVAATSPTAPIICLVVSSSQTLSVGEYSTDLQALGSVVTLPNSSPTSTEKYFLQIPVAHVAYGTHSLARVHV